MQLPDCRSKTPTAFLLRSSTVNSFRIWGKILEAGVWVPPSPTPRQKAIHNIEFFFRKGRKLGKIRNFDFLGFFSLFYNFFFIFFFSFTDVWLVKLSWVFPQNFFSLCTNHVSSKRGLKWLRSYEGKAFYGHPVGVIESGHDTKKRKIKKTCFFNISIFRYFFHFFFSSSKTTS